jgi:hypothetical protein
VRFEQAVYGSFPFWNRGYGVLAHSPGCRSEWLAELRAVCKRYGEPPAGTPHVEGLFVLRLQSGPWLVAAVHSQGRDDLDRPGALAFHALFVSRLAYHWMGSDPFRLRPEFRHDWQPDDQDRALPAGRLSLWPIRPEGPALDPDPKVHTIVTAITRRRRVIVQSTTPIEALARNVWAHLPRRARMRASLATWAFDNGNGFDLVAMPKLTGLAVDPSDLILALEPV